MHNRSFLIKKDFKKPLYREVLKVVLTFSLLPQKIHCKLWPLAPKEGVWGGELFVISLRNQYGNFSANNVEEQNSGNIHMYIVFHN